ncbi:MAG: hypothetical protein ABEJ42_03240 [Halobacteriaceae archaeon]
MSSRARRRLGRLSAAVPDTDRPRAARAMQGLMCLAIVVGAAERNVGVVVNALGGLAVTLLPGALERRLTLPLDAGLSLWVTGAVFLHVVGAVGLPGVPGNLYTGVWWWDHLTHAASAGLVAAMGYVTLRALDEHSDAVDLPAELTVALTLLLVLAFGVYWEGFEYALGHGQVGGESALTQYGVEDTLEDLAFDAAGGLVAGVLGEVYLLGEAVEDLNRRD